MFINNFVLLRLNIALFYVCYTCCLTVAIKQICYVMSSTNRPTSMKYYRSILLLLSGILRAAQSVLGVYFKRTSSRDTSASSARGRILNDSALYKSTLSLTHSLTHRYFMTSPWTQKPDETVPYLVVVLGTLKMRDMNLRDMKMRETR